MTSLGLIEPSTMGTFVSLEKRKEKEFWVKKIKAITTSMLGVVF